MSLKYMSIGTAINAKQIIYCTGIFLQTIYVQENTEINTLYMLYLQENTEINTLHMLLEQMQNINCDKNEIQAGRKCMIFHVQLYHIYECLQFIKAYTLYNITKHLFSIILIANVYIYIYIYILKVFLSEKKNLQHILQFSSLC